MINIDSDEPLKIVHEVDKICSFFLQPFDIPYFQFRRIFRNTPEILLANNSIFSEEFIKGGFIEPKVRQPLHVRQNHYCFWDEALPKTQLSYLRNMLGIHHGLTILNRYKDFYDCASFAMTEQHPSPVANYLCAMKDLQNFAELFPMKAKHIINDTSLYMVTTKKMKNTRLIQKSFFLPKQSVRFYLGNDPKMYVTSYEALCVQLIRQGRTYKEIGSILSMEAGSVKTLLSRLKARTGLSLQEVGLQLLHACSAQTNELSNLGHIKHHNP